MVRASLVHQIINKIINYHHRIEIIGLNMTTMVAEPIDDCKNEILYLRQQNKELKNLVVLALEKRRVKFRSTTCQKYFAMIEISF